MSTRVLVVVYLAERTDVTVITCPRGELLTNGIKQANLGADLSNSEVRTFHAWTESLLPVRDAFITLRYLDGAITPTKVEVYCLMLRDLRIQEPRSIRLYSSNTNSVYPETEIRGVESPILTVVNSGITNISSTDRNGANTTSSNFEYQKYTMTIPENEWIPLQYLRILLDINKHNNCLFVNEALRRSLSW